MKGISLGQVIDTLAAIRPEIEMETPQDLFSWRGVYADLSMYPIADDWRWDYSTRPTAQTVGDLLEICRGALGKVFVGYKGGDFRMNIDTTVWADCYGECNYRCVRGFVMDQGKLAVVTMEGEL